MAEDHQRSDPEPRPGERWHLTIGDMVAPILAHIVEIDETHVRVRIGIGRGRYSTNAYRYARRHIKWYGRVERSKVKGEDNEPESEDKIRE